MLDGLEKLGGIELEALYLLFEVVYVLIDYLKSLSWLFPVLDLNLHQKTPLLALDSQLFSLLKRIFLLSADLNSSGYIKYGLFPIAGNT